MCDVKSDEMKDKKIKLYKGIKIREEKEQCETKEGNKDAKHF